MSPPLPMLERIDFPVPSLQHPNTPATRHCCFVSISSTSKDDTHVVNFAVAVSV